MSRAFETFSTIAERQHGVAARSQGARAGLSRGEIDHAVASGVLIPVATDVYRLPGAPQSLAMATAAAALASNGRTSHATAMRQLRLQAPLPRSRHLLPRGSRPGSAGAWPQETLHT